MFATHKNTKGEDETRIRNFIFGYKIVGKILHESQGKMKIYGNQPKSNKSFPHFSHLLNLIYIFLGIFLKISSRNLR
jgi:hypothetical protein